MNDFPSMDNDFLAPFVKLLADSYEHFTRQKLIDANSATHPPRTGDIRSRFCGFIIGHGVRSVVQLYQPLCARTVRALLAGAHRTSGTRVRGTRTSGCTCRTDATRHRSRLHQRLLRHASVGKRETVHYSTSDRLERDRCRWDAPRPSRNVFNVDRYLGHRSAAAVPAQAMPSDSFKTAWLATLTYRQPRYKNRTPTLTR